MTIAPKVSAEPVTFIEGKPEGWIAECPYCRHTLHISPAQPSSSPPPRGSWRWIEKQVEQKGLPLPPPLPSAALLPSAAYLRGESPQSHWPYALHNEERALLKDLIATVERLCNGLEWNLQHHPTVMNQSDEEALEEARAVLARTQFQQLKETPHDPR